MFKIGDDIVATVTGKIIAMSSNKMFVYVDSELVGIGRSNISLTPKVRVDTMIPHLGMTAQELVFGGRDCGRD